MKSGKWGRNIFARNKQYKLYEDGRLFDVTTDPLEKNPLRPENDDAQTSSARKKLESVLDKMKREM